MQFFLFELFPHSVNSIKEHMTCNPRTSYKLYKIEADCKTIYFLIFSKIKHSLFTHSFY